jgi:steroid delta-isomerase-like uncharacterized protein
MAGRRSGRKPHFFQLKSVAARFIMRGTHQATFFGVPASGKKIQVQAMNFYRFSSGKIVEERGQPDLLALLQQIGAVPA